MVVVTLAVALEAVVVLGYGVYLAVETVIAEATEQLAAAVLAVMVIGLGVALAALARGVLNGRGWVRAPILVWQVMQAAVAVPALPGPRWWLGVVLLVLCIVAGSGVLRDDVLAPVEPPDGDGSRRPD